MSQNLFDVVVSGAVKIRIDARMPLAEAAEAHRLFETRQTTGAMVLTALSRQGPSKPTK